jgi:mevalonate pyrophosphate decarboxylase
MDISIQLQKINGIVSTKNIFFESYQCGFASAPSNIALIKYWGKIENRNQQPDNSSISLTLGDLRTYTKIIALKNNQEHVLMLNGIQKKISSKLLT